MQLHRNVLSLPSCSHRRRLAYFIEFLSPITYGRVELHGRRGYNMYQRKFFHAEIKLLRRETIFISYISNRNRTERILAAGKVSNVF